MPKGDPLSFSQPNPPSNQDPTKRYVLERVESSAFSGPLPQPDILKEYNSIVPGAAERIITMIAAV